MYAIVEDSGTQIKVAKGDLIDIDIRELDAKASSITFDRVLALQDGDGAATLGEPYLDGITVTADIIEERLADKIDVIKFKRRKGYKRKQGHRQRLLRVRVSEIGAAKKTTKKKTTKKTTAKKTTAKKAESEG
ncbi:MAG: 50S ribosomal protein L21 [Phycisphaerales bacterium]|nr:50S ribosomal protein L21 [Phycisphaerales bacterium]